jgi:hypothetical protein
MTNGKAKARLGKLLEVRKTTLARYRDQRKTAKGRTAEYLEAEISSESETVAALELAIQALGR